MIKCFIACAFGRKEIDDLFDNAISIALGDLKIKGLRVDRINHNEKIDLKILKLIDQADFGIADLSFARPSVYFEAGILQGQKKPVIYLAREDHFVPEPEDPFGNKRIHFDLITQNIIPWNQINKTLVNKIRSRIALVIKPIQAKIQNEDRLFESRKIFNNLSIDQRLNKINDLTHRFISKNFKGSKYITNNNRQIIILYAKRKKQFYIIFNFQETFSKLDIRFYGPFGQIWSTPWFEAFTQIPNKIIYFISLRSIRVSSIDSALWTSRKIQNKTYEYINNNKSFIYFIIDNMSDTELITELPKSLGIIENVNFQDKSETNSRR